MGLPAQAMVRGALAGVAGTAVMDLSHFIPYKRAGGEQRLLAWEFSEGMTWETAQAPALVGKRLAEAVLRRELPDRAAPLVNNLMHWAYGISWGAAYGVAASGDALRRRARRRVLDIAFAPTVWTSGYVTLPLLRVYKPIWKYPLRALATDLAGHLCYGAATAVTFRVLPGRSNV